MKPSATQPLGIVVIGLGGFGNFIASRIRQGAMLRLLGGYDPDEEAASAWSDRWQSPVFPSLFEVLNVPGIEAVFLASPNHLHREHSEAAAARGLHIFTTKPIANTVADAQAILNACRRAGVVFYLDHPPAYWTGWVEMMRQRIDAGEIGQIVMAEANGSSPSGLILEPHHWRWQAALCPGGSLIQLGIYQADVLCYLLGPPRQVLSMFNRLYVQAEIPDVTATLIEFESGVLGYLGSSYAAGSDPFWFKVHGTEGSLEQRREGVFIRRGRHSAPEPLLGEEADEAVLQHYHVLLADFVRRVRQGDMSADWSLALQGLAIVEAAVLSNEQRAPVDVAHILAGALPA